MHEHATSAALTEDSVHVWYTVLDDAAVTSRLASYRYMLSEDELQQLQRLSSEALRQRYLCTRALCRNTLSRYERQTPAFWKFERQHHGKPVLLNSQTELCFSISHTNVLSACGVSRTALLGIDIEDTSSDIDMREIAPLYLSAAEQQTLQAMQPTQQRWRSFCYWVLKESYLKALGRGIDARLSRICFARYPFDADTAIYRPNLDDPTSAGRFHLFTLLSTHVGAICRLPENLQIQLRIEATTP